MSNRNAKWLIVIMSLVTATIANAAPTIDSSDSKPALRPISPTPVAGNSSVDEAVGFSDTDNSALADIAAELLKPPADFTNPLVLPPGTKPLPAVPAALFMGLTGFICVTLVRDRKVWLAVLAGLLWAGQAGFTALPQAASYLVGRKHLYQHSQQQNYCMTLQEHARLRSELEGTQYIGLLHHLEGIPGRIERPHVKRGAKYLAPPFRRGFTQLPNFAIAISRTYFVPALNCLAFEVRQFHCFSPAFIFNSIPRGPPISL